MIAVLVAMLPLVACLWLSHMMTRSRPLAAPEPTEHEAPPVADRFAAQPPVRAPLRMDDAPALDVPAWTALDDVQLNRLLDDNSGLGSS
jgi:hypothetical protein